MTTKKPSAERIQELENCFSVLEPNIVYYKRPIHINPEDMRFINFYTLKYLEEANTRTLIIDLSQAHIPSVDDRKKARKLFVSIKEHIDTLVIIISDPLMTVSMKFIFQSILEDINLSVVTELSEALAICRQ